MLVLLTSSATCYGQTVQVLSDWIKAEESLKLYQRLTEDLWRQKIPEQHGLTLLAFLCRERLLPHRTDETAQPTAGSYSADFDAILNGQDIENKRAVFGQVILALWRALFTLHTNEKTVRFLAEVIDIEASVLGALAGLADQDSLRKVHGHNHNRAFEDVGEELSKCVKAMLERDRHADAEWALVPRLPLQLVSVV